MEIWKIIKILNKNRIKFSVTEDNKILIRACELSESNFYDYEEDEPPLTIDNQDLQFLENESNVIIASCGDCCCCAGW